jgi:hypothetical protein
MALFVYLGDHAETATLGFRFRAGEPTEVNDQHAQMKLRGNSHFSEVFDGVEVMPDQPKRKPGRPRKDA